MSNMTQVNPIARQNRGLDRQRSRLVQDAIKVYTVAAGQTITREGSCIVGVDEGGILTVQESLADSKPFIGVSLTDETALPKKSEAETVVVPSSGTTAALRFTPIAASYALMNGATLLIEGGGGDYTLAGSTVTFTAAYLLAHPGESIGVFYTRSISVADLEILGGSSPQGARAGAKFGLIEVATLGEFYTQVYATALQHDYSVGAQIFTGTVGFTSANTSGIKAGRCIKVPAVGDPYLGIELAAAAL